MSDVPSKIEQDRALLRDAQAKGTGATLGAFVRLSGPGWLQSAITLGGGSLAGALFLGALGGVSMLWLQLMAIIMGVVMLSAISYVTLSTGQRPFTAINQHINPALGWGWLLATSMANMIWCMPQFSLSFGALENNLLPNTVQDTNGWKYGVSLVLLVIVSAVLAMNARRGAAAKVFDWLLKGLVGMIVICFIGVVCYLSFKGLLNWGQIFAGFIPDFGQATQPSGDVETLVSQMPAAQQQYWSDAVVKTQRLRMIAAAATAVGINMTFLMPYSMLHRGWDKPFRGLARFDLMTGMAIPYVLVTSCVVIASAYAFHAKADAEFLSNDPAVFESSPTFGGAADRLMGSVDPELRGQKFKKVVKELSPAEKAALISKMAAVPENEKLVASSLVQRNQQALSATLAPLIGKKFATLVFGLGVFGMGFSTIIILMLINGFVFCEAFGKPDSKLLYGLGCFVAGLVGMSWPMFWDGDSKIWLAVLASSFGAMLLPIAYITFVMMMNSKSLMGGEKPTGGSLLGWNLLMGISVIGAVAAAATAIYDKITDKTNTTTQYAGYAVAAMLVVYLLLVVAGFVLKRKSTSPATE